MSSTNQQKYASINPLRKMFLGPFQDRFLKILKAQNPTDILEVGAGEGYLLAEIHDAIPSVRMVGLDLSQSSIDEGRRIFPQLDLRLGDIYHINEPDHAWDTVVASEVLEHLDRPAEALAEIKRVAKRKIVLTVPWEPWFRLLNLARGKHITRFGNHPEHIQNWTKAGFAKFIRTQLEVERVIGAFPWTIIVAKP